VHLSVRTGLHSMAHLAFWFIVAALAVWRMTHLLAVEDGPGGLAARLRAAVGTGFWASLLACFYCLSLWVALPFALALGDGAIEHFMLWLGLSGAACLLDRIGEQAAPLPAFYEGDEEEEHHVVLRRSAPGNHSPGE
jgi:hypothetical protein